ncbi:MAG: hypothetical protein ACLPTF_02210, partial [Steroidobacteraceae bacterium]
TESIAAAERLFIEDFDTWDMTGYYLYSKYWRAGVSAHIGTGGLEYCAISSGVLKMFLRGHWEKGVKCT